MKSLKTTTIALVFAIVGSLTVYAQTASRNVSYHSQDIVPIRAKEKYTTLIVVPATEKIMEAATVVPRGHMYLSAQWASTRSQRM